MKKFITYPLPPEKPEQSIPKFEVFIDWNTYTWSCEIENELEDYDGTFSINQFAQTVHIEWYQISESTELWKAIEEKLRSIIICQTR